MTLRIMTLEQIPILHRDARRNTYDFTFLSPFLQSLLFRPVARFEAQTSPHCTDYRIDLSRELLLWEQEAITDFDLLPLEKRIVLSLASQERSSFGGDFPFRVSESGTYKFSSDIRLWFDVVDEASGKPLSSTDHDMQFRCPVVKVVTFNLEGGRDYLLEVSSSPRESASIMVSRAP